MVPSCGNQHREFVETGIQSFDEAFRGLLPNAITLIYGAPATGKTLLALSFARALLEKGYIGIYVDSDLSLTPRLTRPLRSTRIYFFRPLSVEDYEKALYALSFFLFKGRFVVIDSASLHERGLTNNTISQLLAHLKSLSYIRSSVVESGGIAVITCHSLTGEGPTPKFCSAISDVIFKLSRRVGSASVDILCEKHPYNTLEGRRITISIEELISHLAIVP